MVRVFTKARETWVQSQVESYQRLKKCYLMPPCLTQHYKVRIKGKVEQSWEILGVVAVEKGAFESPSTTVANFTHLQVNIHLFAHSYMVSSIPILLQIIGANMHLIHRWNPNKYYL